MSDDDKNDELGIHRVETIPPPDGEDDAYSAPTKVGPMADAAVKELMHAAARRSSELAARVAEKKGAAADAAKSSATATPMSVKPAEAASVKSPVPSASARPAGPATGPTTGRVPAQSVGPVGRSVSVAPPTSAKPPSIPRPAAVPRVEPAGAPLAPTALSSKDKEALSPAPLPAPAEGAGERPPRLYDASDEPEDAATLLHSSARAPQQEHTALLPASQPLAKPPASVPAPEAVVRPREAIPFDRQPAPMAHEPQGEPKVLIMPLVVGFLIFAIGLAFYIWAR